jgi:cytochrome c oxidase subunit 2
MTFLVILLCVILIAVVAVQLGKLNELSLKIKGEEQAELDANRWSARGFLLFLPLFLIGTVGSAIYYRPYLLGYGPNVAASEHGSSIDHIMWVTIVVTGIVFLLTHIALFWFAYRYKHTKNSKPLFFAHNTNLELVWTFIPAITMAYLVISGLLVWNKVMADVKPGEELLEVEAMGYQFAWGLRHPGKDGLLGTRDYTLISASNPFGQDWSDVKNTDDIQVDELVLPKGKQVRVRITSKDVLHSFYLPHFRVKMDAVPGIPTYFVFTPKYTTQEYREKLRDSGLEFWLEPADPSEPNGARRWEKFEFELACAELCGNGHYSMRRVVRVLPQAEYDKWLEEQYGKSFYLQNVRGKADDPLEGKTLEIETYLKSKEQPASPAQEGTGNDPGTTTAPDTTATEQPKPM